MEEDGIVTLSTDEPEVEEALTATLEDGDGGVSGEEWRWARSQDGQTGWSNISGATSSSYTTTQADAEFFLRATVTYEDRRGGGKRAEAITSQSVLDQNQPPAFPAAEDGQRTIAENTPASANIGAPVAAEDPESDALTYSLTGTDAAAFTIVETTGQIRVKDALDFETKDSYSVTVEVHDRLDTVGNASTAVDDTQAVTITVENEEEPGVVTLTTLAETILARVEVVAALEDGDGSIANLTWQWARSPDGSTDWVNIQGATSAAYTPTLEEDPGSYIRATASYDDGHGSNKAAERVSQLVAAPAITVSRDTLSVVKGGMATYTVRLAFQPTASVTVDVTGGGDVTVNPSSLTFTADNWETPQTVTVRAAEDIDTADDTETITHAVTGDSAPEYVGLSIDSVAVTVTDQPQQANLNTAGGGGGGGGGGEPEQEPEQEPEPPDGSELFGDVEDGAYYEAAVAWMFQQQITAGCGSEPLRYCPDDPVTRAEMAAFLHRALDLDTPEAPAGFADVDPDGVHAAAVEALHGAGITAGCGSEPLRYCPDDPVTRAEMAAFLHRALDLDTPEAPAGFADVDPDGVHAAAVEALHGAGITAGCGSEPLRYCPDDPVTRAQMAAFLHRARNLIAAARPNTN